MKPSLPTGEPIGGPNAPHTWEDAGGRPFREPGEWEVHHDNDAEPENREFHEWWDVADGTRSFRCSDASSAYWLCRVLRGIPPARPLFRLVTENGESTGLPEYSESEALSAMMHLSRCHGVKTRMELVKKGKT